MAATIAHAKKEIKRKVDEIKKAKKRGRPAIEAGGIASVIRTRLPPTLRADFDRVVTQTGRSPSAVARELMSAALAELARLERS